MSVFFISYSRKDAGAIANNLRNHIVKLDSGHDVFLDVQSIKTGADWQQELKRKIAGCDYFIYIHSPCSIKSPYVKNELNWVKAAELKSGIRKLFVYRIGYAELTSDIATYQILDASDNFAVVFFRLMSGVLSGNSFYNVKYDIELADEFWYNGKVWIEAPENFLKKIQMVEYRFDYGWSENLFTIKTTAASLKNKFSIPFETKYHFTLFVMLYLWNTRELPFVVKIPICQ